MKAFSFFFFLLIPFIAISQDFPTDAKVLQDVKNYHTKIATAKVQNEWKLEREAGYNFSNMAKRVVAATTIKENGVSKNIIGLAIYVRGGAGEKWNFSRYFVTGSEVVGAKALTTEDLKQQTIDLIKTDIVKVFHQYKFIPWVYDIAFESATPDRTDRTGDVIYKCILEYDLMFNDSEGITLPNYPFEAGLKRFRIPAEAYVRLVDGKMKVAIVTQGYAEPAKKTMLNRKQYESLKTLTSENFDQMFGPEGLPFDKQDDQKSESEKKKGLKLPKVKISGF